MIRIVIKLNMVKNIERDIMRHSVIYSEIYIKKHNEVN